MLDHLGGGPGKDAGLGTVVAGALDRVVELARVGGGGLDQLGHDLFFLPAKEID
ncbi:hypothetical protein [Cryobacterium algoritolerans]|uniref:hypothetical protein n=1 Tax=Cryobacterium algoritolerans TaxID=1259184 RepID=UPI00141BB44F|nr:hypothetical protein [Cryobacterium algoritolerans]